MSLFPASVSGLVTTLTMDTSDASTRQIVIVAARRSAITKAKKGGFKSLKADQILAETLSGLINSTNGRISRSDIRDIIIGNCLQPGGGQLMARIAAFEAGFSDGVSVATTNRQCSSGLQALAIVAGQIRLGVYDMAIGGGVESMSSCSFDGATPIVDMSDAKKNAGAAACMMPMGITSENVSQRFRISRSDMDRFSLESHKKAADAQRRGFFREEIVTVRGISSDDGIRENASLEALMALKPSFVANGTTTAGNSSQLSDGAAAVVMTTAVLAKSLDLSPLAIWMSFAVAGVPPDVMGIGPVFAIPEAIRKAGLTISDIDVFEINEAFASQCLFCIQYLGIDPNKCNPLGGAIAIGHPLGCTGARQVVTMIHYLRRTGKRYAVISMCVGTGMGAACVIENPEFGKPTSPPLARL